jgi:hypothetical protein
MRWWCHRMLSRAKPYCSATGKCKPASELVHQGTKAACWPRHLSTGISPREKENLVPLLTCSGGSNFPLSLPPPYLTASATSLYCTVTHMVCSEFGAMDLRALHTRVRSSRLSWDFSCAFGLFLHACPSCDYCCRNRTGHSVVEALVLYRMAVLQYNKPRSALTPLLLLFLSPRCKAIGLMSVVQVYCRRCDRCSRQRVWPMPESS